MNRRGKRFLTVGQFISHASALKVKRLGDRELEFYERHCLLLPVARTHMPAAYAVALPQERLGGAVSKPEDLEPPDKWLRLNRGYEDGMHAFDRERGNSLLVIPDCTTFQPWDTDRVAATRADGRRVRRRRIERYYASWQVHVVELLRRRWYYRRAPFLNALPESHVLRERYRLPEDTEEVRNLRGMAAGYDALTLFGVAAEIADNEAFASVPTGQGLSELTSSELQDLLAHRAQRALHISGVDEPALFGFVGELTRLIHAYRADERISLAEDAEQDLWDTGEFAHFGFGHDGDELLAAAESHIGGHLVATLRRLDPVEAAAHDARENLASILEDGLGASISSDGDDHPDTPQKIVEFCLKHDLFEVLSALQNYSFTTADQQRDNYPGFLHRRLRPLALAVEQLARGILETTREPHHKETLSGLIKIIGANSPWLRHFELLISQGKTSDKQGDLDRKALALARSIRTLDSEDDKAIATTLVSAVAARNLVAHRHKFLSREETMTLGGVCATSVVLVWLQAEAEGLV